LDIKRPPAFCQYSAGPCDQSFDEIAETGGVVLYPSQPPQIAATIEGAADAISRASGRRWLGWRDFRTAGQVIFCAICRQVRFSGVVVADVTTLNLNLLFEIGFVLGLELPLLLIRDTSYLKDLREFDELGLLDTIGYLDFQTSDGLAASVLHNIPATPLPSPAVTLSRETPLYVVKDPVAHEGQVRLLSTLKKSPVRFRTYDPLEDPRLTLHDARKQVGASLGVVGHLLAPERRGSVVHNARSALVAGLAVATGKHVLLLQEGQSRQPLDYRDIVWPYVTPNQIPRALEGIIYKVTVGLQEQGPTTERTPFGLLEQLDLGALVAENEIRKLRAYFVRTAQFNQARQGHSRLVVGRKGAGKTAIFYAVRDSLPKTPSHLVLDMKPEGHQFTKLREAVLSKLSPGLQEHTLTAFWNYILLCELAQKVLEEDTSWAQRDPDRFAQFEALRHLYHVVMPDDTGDLSERLLRQIDRLADRFERAGAPTESRAVTHALFTDDIPALDRAIAAYLCHKETVWLLVDNLDKGWATHGANAADILLIRTLLDATRKLQRQLVEHDVEFHTLVFLRNDIYDLLVRHTPDRDKDTAISLDWDDPALFKEIVRQRILATSDLRGEFERVWPMIAESFVGAQDSFGFVVERTMMRPRDLLKFLHRAVEFAVNRGHERVTTEDFLSAEKAFSNDMLVSVNFELTDVGPSATDLLYHFIGCPIEMSHRYVTDLLTKEGIPPERISDTINLLIWFGFLGVSAGVTDEPQYAFQVHYNLTKLQAVLRSDSGRLVVHPAFRNALGCSQQSEPSLPM
jgi:hypothetical protein